MQSQAKLKNNEPKPASTSSLPTNTNLIKDLTCPVTLSIFNEPVRLNCTELHAIEETAAKKILSTTKKCPCCREQVSSYGLDKLLKNLVLSYLKEHSDLQEEQYQPSDEEDLSLIEEKQSSDPFAPDATEAEVAVQRNLFNQIAADRNRQAESSSSASGTNSYMRMFSEFASMPSIANGVARNLPMDEMSEIPEIAEEKTAQIALPSFAITTNNLVGKAIKILLLAESNLDKIQFSQTIARGRFARIALTDRISQSLGLSYENLNLGSHHFVLHNQTSLEQYSLLPFLSSGANILLVFGGLEPWLRDISRNFGLQSLNIFSIDYVNDASEVELSQFNIMHVSEEHRAMPVIKQAPEIAKRLGRTLLQNLATQLTPREIPEHAIDIPARPTDGAASAKCTIL